MIPTTDVERFNFLKTHAPPPCDELLKKVYADIDEKRIEILEAERFIHLSLLTQTTKYPAKFMPPLNKFKEMLKNQVILTSEEVDPSFVQHTSLLISYVYGNIDQLVKGVAEMGDSEEFPFIVSSMLPSIFGFFISSEYVQYAIQFYKSFILTQKTNLSLIVIQPFFCSISTYRYIENVMDPFLIKLGTESLNKSEPFPQEFMTKYSNILTNNIVNSMPLLPDAFFEIFKAALEAKWSKNKLIHLFFTSFFKPQSKMFFYSSPFSRTDNVFKIIDNVARDDQYFTKILNSFYAPFPKKEIMPIYTPFKQVFVSLFLSISDVLMVTACCLKGGSLPNVLDDINSNKYDSEIKFNPFIVRIYTKELKVAPPKIDRLIIPSFEGVETNPNYERTYRAMKSVIPKTTTVYEELVKRKHEEDEFINYALKKAISEKQQLVESLENYLVAKYYHDRLLDLREIVRSREDFIKIPFVLADISNYNIYTPFLSTHAKEVLFLTSMCKRAQFIYNKVHTDFEYLQSRWEKLSLSRRNNRELTLVNTLSRSRQEIFWQAVDIVSCLINIPLSRSFELLMKALRMVYLICPTRIKELLRTLMIFSKSKFVPLVFEIHNELAMKDDMFKYFLNDDDYVLWLAFQQFLYSYANENLKDENEKDALKLFITTTTKFSDAVREMKLKNDKNIKPKSRRNSEKKELKSKEKIEKEKIKKEKIESNKLKKEKAKQEKLEKRKLRKEKREKRRMDKSTKKDNDIETDDTEYTEETEETDDKEEEEEEIENNNNGVQFV